MLNEVSISSCSGSLRPDLFKLTVTCQTGAKQHQNPTGDVFFQTNSETVALWWKASPTLI